MVIAEKKLNIEKLIVFAYFAIFPFGQLTSIPLEFFGITTRLNVLDIAVSTALIYNLFKFQSIKKDFFLISFFLLSCFFSFLISLSHFPLGDVLRGSLYLVRLVLYLSFFVFIKRSLIENRLQKKLLLKILFSSFFVFCIFGITQYIYFPDTRFLTFLGWDDHFYRLIGTLLDPGFTGAILSCASLLTLYLYVKSKYRYLLIFFVMFTISLLLTYSRASYLSFLVGIAFLGLIEKKVKLAVFITTIFIALLPFLPKPGGYGVKLERTHSIYSRIDNKSQTLLIFSKFPLFGIGFNNFCPARIKFTNDIGYTSHACSGGSDISILYLLTTTGVVGTILFANYIFGQTKNWKIDKNSLEIIVLSSLIVGSFFNNLLFYPWIMGVFAVFLAISVKNKNIK